MTDYRETHTVEAGPDGSDKPVLAMRFRYTEAGGRGRPRTLRLRHRLWAPAEIERALRGARLTPIARWGGFDGAALDEANATEQHVFLARRGAPPGSPRRLETGKGGRRTGG